MRAVAPAGAMAVPMTVPMTGATAGATAEATAGVPHEVPAGMPAAARAAAARQRVRGPAAAGPAGPVPPGRGRPRRSAAGPGPAGRVPASWERVPLVPRAPRVTGSGARPGPRRGTSAPTRPPPGDAGPGQDAGRGSAAEQGSAAAGPCSRPGPGSARVPREAAVAPCPPHRPAGSYRGPRPNRSSTGCSWGSTGPGRSPEPARRRTRKNRRSQKWVRSWFTDSVSARPGVCVHIYQTCGPGGSTP